MMERSRFAWGMMLLALVLLSAGVGGCEKTIREVGSPVAAP
jgi:hypothetical protein